MSNFRIWFQKVLDSQDRGTADRDGEATGIDARNEEEFESLDGRISWNPEASEPCESGVPGETGPEHESRTCGDDKEK